MNCDGYCNSKHLDISTSRSLKLVVYDRYMGVAQSKGKFAASICANGKSYFLGNYATESEAARAVDEAHIYRVSLIVRSLSNSDCDKLALKAQVLEANALTCGTIACSMSYITTVCLKWAFACH